MEADIDGVDLTIQAHVPLHSLLHPCHIWIGGYEFSVACFSEGEDQHSSIDCPKCIRVGGVADSRTVELRKPFDVDSLVTAFFGDVDIGKSFDVDDGDCGFDGSDQEPREIEAAGGGFEWKLKLHLEGVAGIHSPKFYEVIVPKSHQAAHFSDPEDAADGSVMNSKGNDVASRALDGSHIATC